MSSSAPDLIIPGKSVASNQDVQVALVLNKSGEDDPTNAWSLANSEALSSSSGAVVWYLATGKQQSDTFFAHGGFFSPLNAPKAVNYKVQVPFYLTGSVGNPLAYPITWQY